MSTDTALIEKREELKRRLAAGEYKTLVDVFLEWFDRLIRKITRQAKPLPIWYITVFLSLFVILIGLAAIIIAGDLATTREVVELYRLGFWLGVLIEIISPCCVAVITAIASNRYVGEIFILWRDYMLVETESVVNVVEFQVWLKKVCRWRLHLLVAIIGGGATASYYVTIVSTQQGVFTGYGFAFLNVIVFTLGWIFFYLFLMVFLLAAGLRHYDLKLFAADPASSKIINRLSSKLSIMVYFTALFAAYMALVSALGGYLPRVGITMLFMLWLPIIVMFILNHTSLSNIIRRAKWKTLNKIQAKVEKLQEAKNFEARENMDAINRLMDYHERVNKTRNSALDFGAYLSFLNSLLLPLLAFVLGNLDFVLNLFVRKP